MQVNQVPIALWSINRFVKGKLMKKFKVKKYPLLFLITKHKYQQPQ